MPRAPINGVDLYYEIYGEGPTIVWVHGGAGNHLMWWQQVPYFRQAYRCVLFDFRGYGQSYDIRGGPGAGAQQDDLAALLDYLKIDECRLVVQAATAAAPFGVAVSQQERVRAYVMTGGFIQCTEVMDEFSRLLAEGKTGFGQTLDPAFYTKDPHRAFLYDHIRSLNALHRTANPQPGGGAYDSRMSRMASQGAYSAAELASLKVPSLLVWGERDTRVIPEIGRMQQRILPNSRYFEVADTGHSPFYERPEEYNRILDEFFQQL